jgi:ketosteroid isomerase-like protein
MSIDVVKQMYDAFEEGDMPKALSLVSEDCQWDHRGPPGPPINKLYVGREGVQEFYRTLGETQEVLDFEAQEFFESGNRVVAIGTCRFRVKETGKEWGSKWVGAYTVEDGLIKSWTPVFDMSAEAEAYKP